MLGRGSWGSRFCRLRSRGCTWGQVALCGKGKEEGRREGGRVTVVVPQPEEHKQYTKKTPIHLLLLFGAWRAHLSLPHIRLPPVYASTAPCVMRRFHQLKKNVKKKWVLSAPIESLKCGCLVCPHTHTPHTHPSPKFVPVIVTELPPVVGPMPEPCPLPVRSETEGGVNDTRNSVPVAGCPPTSRLTRTLMPTPTAGHDTCPMCPRQPANTHIHTNSARKEPQNNAYAPLSCTQRMHADHKR
jgi:hypothetical protein